MDCLISPIIERPRGTRSCQEVQCSLLTVIAVLTAVRRREVRAWFKSHRMLVLIKVWVWLLPKRRVHCLVWVCSWQRRIIKKKKGSCTILLPWGLKESLAPNQIKSMCTRTTCTAGEQQGRILEKLDDEKGETECGKEIRNGTSIFNTYCVLWDLPSDDLINPLLV